MAHSGSPVPTAARRVAMIVHYLTLRRSWENSSRRLNPVMPLLSSSLSLFGTSPPLKESKCKTPSTTT